MGSERGDEVECRWNLVLRYDYRARARARASPRKSVGTIRGKRERDKGKERKTRDSKGEKRMEVPWRPRFSTLELKSNDRSPRARGERASENGVHITYLYLYIAFPFSSFSLRVRHALPFSLPYAPFVSRAAPTAISRARGAISADDFHTLPVERLD